MRRKNQSNEFIKDCLAISYVKLLYTKPKEDITITDICNKSGFGRTTYYRHFSNDKNDLILYIAIRKWEDYKVQHAEAVKTNEGFELAKHVYQNKEFMLMLKKQNLIELLFRMLFEIFGIKENEDPLLRYGKDVFIGMYFGIIYDWILMGCVDTPEQIKSNIEKSFAMAAETAKVNQKI